MASSSFLPSRHCKIRLLANKLSFALLPCKFVPLFPALPSLLRWVLARTVVDGLAMEYIARRHLVDLPVKCLLRVMQLLDPIDLCSIATTCKSLSVVADSNASWSVKVPIYPRVLDLSKKQIYFRLRSQVRQQYWSHPAIARGCFLMPARQLYIVWVEDPRYWEWSSSIVGSWFSETAYLRDVCWLEIAGSCEMIFRPGRYLALFRIRLHNISGFDRQPLTLSLSTSNGQSVRSQGWLQGPQSRTEAPLREVGGWLELDVGEFIVEDEMLLKVTASMRVTESNWWKSGLVVDCLKIQPWSAAS